MFERAPLLDFVLFAQATPLFAQATHSPATSDISLTWSEVAIAASLIGINAILSWKLRLGLERQIAISAIRMTVQLALLGLVLKQIFSLSSAAPVLALATVMTIVAGVAAVRRIDHRFDSIYPSALFAVWSSTWLVTAVTVLLIVRPQPWHSPQVVIPLLGMVLGNSLTGISLGLDRFLSELRQRRDEVELRLTMGMSRRLCQRDSDGHDPHPQYDVRGRNCESAGDDDGPTARWGAADPGGAVPDHDHVRDRGGHRHRRHAGSVGRLSADYHADAPNRLAADSVKDGMSDNMGQASGACVAEQRSRTRTPTPRHPLGATEAS